MIRKIREILLIGLTIFTFLSIYSSDESITSSCTEKLIIDRYTLNYRSAINHYNKLIDRWNKKQLSECEQKAVIDARIAEKKRQYPWGFQWIATCIATYSYTATIDSSDSYLNDMAKNRFNAIVGKVNDKDPLMDTPHVPQGVMQAIIINRNSFRRRDTTKQLTDQETSIELYHGKNRILTRKEIVNKLAYHRSMFLHQQKPKEYTISDTTPKQRQKFSEKFWPTIEKETWEQQITRLKLKNPIDTNPATNKFARLFEVNKFKKLFDRII